MGLREFEEAMALREFEEGMVLVLVSETTEIMVQKNRLQVAQVWVDVWYDVGDLP